MSYPKLFLQVAIIVTAVLIQVTSLECYSCDSDLMDFDCNKIETLPKVVCANTTASNLVALSCGSQHVIAKDSSAERIFRGCMVAGECGLLSRQVELTQAYRMASCHECGLDNCNDSGTSIGRESFSMIGSLMVGSVAFLLHRVALL
ncbi:uncharacterized protein LOC131694937 [Topomyia yanbarensis]|uniref:uncharacterized protein LOC131694937 n=1 Tax=Topomyia yanbarensis TaxID=2498891 RepID=UPI00273BEF6D|nr:uncharacterized protein LOC131694937 [Topomyia yanbarensis]